MKEKRNYTVYLHTSPSGKYYVGITSQKVELRWRKGRGYKGQFFHIAIEKYGWENIDHEIIASNLTKEEAENFEILLIKELHSNEKEFGYNVDNGGNTMGTHNQETKIKISKANKGKIRTAETRRKISLSKKGKPCSEEQKEFMRKRMERENNPFYGKNHTKETKDKISQSKKGKKIHTEERKQEVRELLREYRCKKVICEDKEFNSAKECAEYYDINYSTMRSWLQGKNKMRQDFIDKGLRYKES